MSGTAKSANKRSEPLGAGFALDMVTSAINYVIAAGLEVRVVNRDGVAWIAIKGAATNTDGGELKLELAPDAAQPGVYAVKKD